MIQNPKLRAIADKASTNLLALIRESEEKILEAWNATTNEAQQNESAPKFNLGFSIGLDLDADKMTTALSFSVKHKLSAEEAIPNPDQPNLPGVESMTFSHGDSSVTLTANDAADIAKAVDIQLAKADDEEAELMKQAIECIRSEQKASVSLLQRRFKIGYSRAASIMDRLEEKGIVGPSIGAEPREVLIKPA